MPDDPAEIRRAALLEAAEIAQHDTGMMPGGYYAYGPTVAQRIANAIRERAGQPADAGRVAELEALLAFTTRERSEMLEKWGDYPILASGLKAAEAQVAALREENERLAALLRPFAKLGEHCRHKRGDEQVVFGAAGKDHGAWITYGDLRRTAQALADRETRG